MYESDFWMYTHLYKVKSKFANISRPWDTLLNFFKIIYFIFYSCIVIIFKLIVYAFNGNLIKLKRIQIKLINNYNLNISRVCI